MSRHYRWLQVSALCLMAWRVEAAELLGKISDETAPPADQAQPAAADNGRKIIYRVICEPEGEQLPECQQSPVNDSFDAPQPKAAEQANIASPAAKEQEHATQELASDDDNLDEKPKAVAPKKSSSHKAHKKPAKKPGKKAVKNTDKKSVKTEKKSKRR